MKCVNAGCPESRWYGKRVMKSVTLANRTVSSRLLSGRDEI
jgi:hypothetical protein